jgi:enoyl-CoA hydratase
MSVAVARDRAVAIVTIDRPEALNALDIATAESLRDALIELAGDAAVRAVVLTGAGDRAFIAGADIAYMRDLGPTAAKAWGELGHDCARLLETMPKPTIAAVNGFALGGGCEMALACDVRYASSTAKFGQPEVNLGIIPGWGGTQRLARVCGLGIAKELILTGRVVDAAEAERRGLVNAVFEPDELLVRTLEIAQALAAKGASSLALAKELCNLSLQGDHAAQLVHEATAFPLLFDTDDQSEGMSAFLEKRPPAFS